MVQSKLLVSLFMQRYNRNKDAFSTLVCYIKKKKTLVFIFSIVYSPYFCEGSKRANIYALSFLFYCPSLTFLGNEIPRLCFPFSCYYCIFSSDSVNVIPSPFSFYSHHFQGCSFQACVPTQAAVRSRHRSWLRCLAEHNAFCMDFSYDFL